MHVGRSNAGKTVNNNLQRSERVAEVQRGSIVRSNRQATGSVQHIQPRFEGRVQRGEASVTPESRGHECGLTTTNRPPHPLTFRLLSKRNGWFQAAAAHRQ